MVQPPSHTLKEVFQKLKGWPPSQQYIEEAAKKMLLLPDEVRMWFDHLQSVSDNRKWGAAQAAETWRKKKKSTKCHWCTVEFVMSNTKISQKK